MKLAPLFWLTGSTLLLINSLANPLTAFAAVFFIVGSILAIAEK